MARPARWRVRRRAAVMSATIASCAPWQVSSSRVRRLAHTAPEPPLVPFQVPPAFVPNQAPSSLRCPQTAWPTHPNPPDRNLLFFNDLGGFTGDGRNTSFTSHTGRRPRLPGAMSWQIHFGFLATESGPGTWSENSHKNRLAPWSNDPVSIPGERCFFATKGPATLVTTPPRPGDQPASSGTDGDIRSITTRPINGARISRCSCRPMTP